MTAITQTILAVDDEPNYLVVLSELLREEGFEVLTASSGIEALQLFRSSDVDLVVSDMRMPGMDGIELLRAVKEKNCDLPVILVTAFGEVEKAVTAMRSGAYTYLTKPFNNEDLVHNVKNAVGHYAVLKDNRRLKDEVRGRYSFDNLIGKNQKMLHVYEMVRKVAPTPASVLITGESGTGKELVARAIHHASPRDKETFVSVNCAALPETLLESELFGHEKGAFTGAVSLRKGRFELAEKGTLFLDEIGELALHLQSKLLRVLQEKSFERVGGSRTLSVDVRIIAATNRDLKDEVDQGRFREDLYYRLNVIRIHIPPLRERPDDIPLLVAHFVDKYGKIFQKPEVEISGQAMRLLTSQPWDGNVRELENTVERAVILCDNNRIESDDVQPESRLAQEEKDWERAFDLRRFIPSETPLPEVMDVIEKKMVQQALEDAGLVQARAAERLGITKSLLQYKMKKFGLRRGETDAG